MYARVGEENQEKEIPKEMNMVEIKKVRPQLLTRLLIIMACALLAASCRSRKALTQGGTPGLSSEEMLEKAVEVANCNRLTAQYLTARLSVSASAGGKNLGMGGLLGGTLRMKRDDVIQISLVALGIMEVGRLEMTKDYLMMVDRRNHKYVKVNYDDVPALKQAGIDFYTFQALFWDELFLPFGKGEAPQSGQFVKSAEREDVRLSNSDSGVATLSFLVSTLYGMVSETSVSVLKDEKSPILQWQYSNYEKVDGQHFPTRMEIRINGGKPIGAVFSLSNVRSEGGWDTRTELSKKYTEIPLETIMGALLKQVK